MRSIEIKTTGLRDVARAAMLCGALFAFAATSAATSAARADALSEGAAHYKPFAVEHIGKAIAGAKELQAAVKAGDVKKAQAAWIKSRKGWEAIEPITGEFSATRRGRSTPGRTPSRAITRSRRRCSPASSTELDKPVDALVANLTKFEKQREREGLPVQPAGPAQRHHQPCLRGRRRTSPRAASRPMPAPRSSTCRKTSRASKRSTSWCSREL